MAYTYPQIERYELLQPAFDELNLDRIFGHEEKVKLRHENIATRWSSFLTHPASFNYWKEKALDNIKKRVDEVIQSFNAPTSTRDDLIEYWDRDFSPAHYFIIFDYMKGLVDYEKSKPLGQYYMKSLYVTLAVKVTQLRLTERYGNNDRLVAALQTELSVVYDRFPSHKNFDGLSREDFFDISSDEQRDLEIKEAEKLVADSYCFVIGEVPTKTGRS